MSSTARHRPRGATNYRHLCFLGDLEIASAHLAKLIRPCDHFLRRDGLLSKLIDRLTTVDGAAS